MFSTSRIAAKSVLRLAQRRTLIAQPTRAAWKIGETSTGASISTKFDLPDPGRSDDCYIHGKKPLQLTKIVATIGPTSEQLEPLTEVVKNGMSVMRLNFSHATKEEVELRCTNLEIAEKKLSPAGAPETQQIRSLLLDTRGPEIRSGKLKNDHSGHETITLQKGNKITLQTSKQYEEEGSDENNLFINYAGLSKSLNPGMNVLLDDGVVIMTVDSVGDGSVVCSIDNTGEIRSRAGVNLPMAETDLPAMSDKDKADIKYGMTKDIDFIAASFVQTADGVREIKQYVKDCAKELGLPDDYSLPKIISKIESGSGLKHFDEILTESDGIMVARGDLGVEIPIQQVTNAQKEMVAACNAVGKPVIVATQMLESMAKNPRPTRAEVSDVTNAVYDGADAVMLSGETAKGKYPVDAIRTMNEIILAAEGYSFSGGLGSEKTKIRQPFIGPKTPNSSIARGAVSAAETRDASAIIVLGDEQELAQHVSSYRPSVPILAFCANSKMARQLILNRAIHPIVGLGDVPPEKKPAAAIKLAKELGHVQAGQNVVLVHIDDEEDLGHAETLQLVSVP
ncbi:Pyruvate kinase [Seminavis robusta]|uniref:Pyruvate kinase n=1 Tax=Seminavis robusta TaxID=568900 RepID=A0A9N8H5S9_9STRA|nr:Pyruvate kinase [Seminavis robusta]|eukprot:Sro94_g048890.1 Pyruvate kinase (566) ;mRNA; r:29222-31265